MPLFHTKAVLCEANSNDNEMVYAWPGTPALWRTRYRGALARALAGFERTQHADGTAHFVLGTFRHGNYLTREIRYVNVAHKIWLHAVRDAAGQLRYFARFGLPTPGQCADPRDLDISPEVGLTGEQAGMAFWLGSFPGFRATSPYFVSETPAAAIIQTAMLYHHVFLPALRVFVGTLGRLDDLEAVNQLKMMMSENMTRLPVHQQVGFHDAPLTF
jgi:hypothetical protein